MLGVEGTVEVAEGLKELGSILSPFSTSSGCTRTPPFLLVGSSANGRRGFSVVGPRLRPSELGSSKAESRKMANQALLR